MAEAQGAPYRIAVAEQTRQEAPGEGVARAHRLDHPHLRCPQVYVSGPTYAVAARAPSLTTRTRGCGSRARTASGRGAAPQSARASSRPTSTRSAP